MSLNSILFPFNYFGRKTVGGCPCEWPWGVSFSYWLYIFHLQVHYLSDESEGWKQKGSLCQMDNIFLSQKMRFGWTHVYEMSWWSRCSKLLNRGSFKALIGFYSHIFRLILGTALNKHLLQQKLMKYISTFAHDMDAFSPVSLKQKVELSNGY